MRVDAEKLRKAGRDVHALRDEVLADPVPQALVDAQSGLVGLSITEALAAAVSGYREFQGSFGGELDYLGNGVIAAGSDFEGTDEQAKDSIAQLDVPG